MQIEHINKSIFYKFSGTPIITHVACFLTHNQKKMHLPLVKEMHQSGIRQFILTQLACTKFTYVKLAVVINTANENIIVNESQ